ncbi:hypothetical protein FKW77_009504 [Venturia effusa]|uniref:Uncharacterized protein n=1 Tax=Venturia effusa TaxID=50376 RepID=A0A517LEK7_9PEZI|nr:hypothetical protein FKW77_009504 [Venturia effusa]
MKLTNSLAIAATLIANAITALPTTPSSNLASRSVSNSHAHNNVLEVEIIGPPFRKEFSWREEAHWKDLNARFDPDAMQAEICENPANAKYPGCQELYAQRPPSKGSIPPPPPGQKGAYTDLHVRN